MTTFTRELLVTWKTAPEFPLPISVRWDEYGWVATSVCCDGQSIHAAGPAEAVVNFLKRLDSKAKWVRKRIAKGYYTAEVKAFQAGKRRPVS